MAICCSIMSVITCLNVILILYTYIRENLAKNLNKEQLRNFNRIRKQELIIIFLSIFLLMCIFIYKSLTLFIIIISFVSGSSPIPFSTLIDILFILEIKNAN